MKNDNTRLFKVEWVLPTEYLPNGYESTIEHSLMILREIGTDNEYMVDAIGFNCTDIEADAIVECVLSCSVEIDEDGNSYNYITTRHITPARRGAINSHDSQDNINPLNTPEK